MSATIARLMTLLAVLLMPFAMSGAFAAAGPGHVLSGHCAPAQSTSHKATAADCAVTCAVVAAPVARMMPRMAAVLALPPVPAEILFRGTEPPLSTPPPKAG